MQAKIKRWTSRNPISIRNSDEDIQNKKENPFFNSGDDVQVKLDPAIPCIKPKPLKRINATFNLLFKEDLSLKN